MKNLFYLLLTIPFFLASCSNEDMAASEETVEVSFIAQVPQGMGTRASSITTVDKVYCAVFENDEEILGLRTEIDIDGEDINFTPRLIKGRTYDVVFWAAKDGSYNVDYMTNITRIAGKDEAEYDAFTATTEITVEGNISKSVTLYRPLAQLNMGVTEDDWNGVANSNTFNLTPDRIELTIENVYTSFNALDGYAQDQDAFLYNLPVTGADFQADSKVYKYIAQCYVLMSETQQNDKGNFNLSYSIYSETKAIRENAEIIHVPLQANYKTNVVGGLLTGEIEYTISFGNEGGFNGDHNEDI